MLRKLLREAWELSLEGIAEGELCLDRLSATPESSAGPTNTPAYR